ncbi:TPA: hypothetical protein OX083_002163 [Legionella pneumophila]|nr:hypothetical protein [Legionella pneumophila]
MDFVINENELSALCGLPHAQQLAYLRGIRPYMNVKTGMVGIERGISYQSIAEQLYIEPHQGIKSASYSRAQTRRAIASLERVGLIQFHSDEYKLILKCLLATRDYYVSKKAVTNPSHQSITFSDSEPVENNEYFQLNTAKAIIAENQKADTPHINNNYLYLFKQFEKFWSVYPSKKSRQKAWDEFERLNPVDIQLEQIITALKAQIQNREAQQLAGEWLPPWKYPANWLAQKCWNDELTTSNAKEKCNAKYTANNAPKSGNAIFWGSCGEASFDFENDTIAQSGTSNVVQFAKS